MIKILLSIQKRAIRFEEKKYFCKGVILKKIYKRVVKPKKGKGSYNRRKLQESLAPIFCIIFDDILVPFLRQSFKFILLVKP